MILLVVPDSKVIPLYADAIGGPLAGLCEYHKTTKALDGRTITFHPGKDPVSCREAALQRFRTGLEGRVRGRVGTFGQPGIAGQGGLGIRGVLPGEPGMGGVTEAGEAGGASLSPRPAPKRPALGGESMSGATFDPSAFWRDVRCETYVEYRQGRRHGVQATWDAEGRKRYWGQYERDQRHEFCCLFKNDQPAIVLVCDQGQVGAVHLIANGKIARSFANEEEAQGNASARPLLAEINDFEAQYQRNERALQAQIKKTIQIRIGEINKERRAADQSRRSARDARQKENFNNLRKTTGQ